MKARYYRYEVYFRKGDGVDRKVIVLARNEFEAVQLAGAFGVDCVVFSVINLDL